MPYALKGIDATIYMVFQALVVRVTVHPIFKSTEIDEYVENTIDAIGEYDDEEYSGSESDLEEYLENRRREIMDRVQRTSRIGNKFHDLKLVDAQTECDPDEAQTPLPSE
jgi:hypothetical protein